MTFKLANQNNLMYILVNLFSRRALLGVRIWISPTSAICHVWTLVDHYTRDLMNVLELNQKECVTCKGLLMPPSFRL